jgi:hypothetical protein
MINWIKGHWDAIQSNTTRVVIASVMTGLIGILGTLMMTSYNAFALPLKTDRRVDKIEVEQKRLDSIKIDKKTFEDYKTLHDLKDALIKESLAKSINSQDAKLDYIVRLLGGNPKGLKANIVKESKNE